MTSPTIPSSSLSFINVTLELADFQVIYLSNIVNLHHPTMPSRLTSYSPPNANPKPKHLAANTKLGPALMAGNVAYLLDALNFRTGSAEKKSDLSRRTPFSHSEQVNFALTRTKHPLLLAGEGELGASFASLLLRPICHCKDAARPLPGVFKFMYIIHVLWACLNKKDYSDPNSSRHRRASCRPQERNFVVV